MIYFKGNDVTPSINASSAPAPAAATDDKAAPAAAPVAQGPTGPSTLERAPQQDEFKPSATAEKPAEAAPAPKPEDAPKA